MGDWIIEIKRLIFGTWSSDHPREVTFHNEFLPFLLCMYVTHTTYVLLMSVLHS